MERVKPVSAERTGSGGPAADPAASADGPVRDRLGEFRILREVGRGGMGVVYEAVQESLGRHVALKILPRSWRLSATQIERFQLEARSAARLHHGHIVPVHGVGQHERVHYYAMQFIAGHGLDAILDDCGGSAGWLRMQRRSAPMRGPSPRCGMRAVRWPWRVRS
jgi:serine/threonine protein kinase